MDEPRILKLPRSDAEGQYAVLKITSTGSQSLDLELVGTEGAGIYVGSIRQRDITKLKSKRFQGSEAELQGALCKVLLQQPVSKEFAEASKDLEAAVSVTDEENMTVSLRKRISGIIQQVASISMPYDGDREENFVQWTALAAQSATTTLESVADLKCRYKEQQDMVKRLNSQLEDLIKAKKEHEDAMLEKFKDLLNAKKLKIRDQQRLLAGAKVDPGAAHQVQNAREGTGKRKPASSRTSKRKAKDSVPAVEDEDEIDEGTAMRMDEIDAEAEQEKVEELERAMTPDKSDLDETADEASEDEGFAPAPEPSQRSLRGIGSKGKAIETTTRSAASKEDAAPPPRRELPFARQAQEIQMLKNQRQAATKPAADEDEDTDDEL